LRTEKQHKKQMSAMAFCLLLLPRPTASRYTVLLPLLPLHAVSVAVAVAITIVVAVVVATVSFAAALS